jgi:tetratricopeptide (TPR) repeat protein
MKFVLKYIIFLSSPFLLAQNAKKLDSMILRAIENHNNKDYQLSLKVLTEVRTVAEEKHLYKQLFLSLNNIGTNYYSMLDYGEALDNYLEAYTIALKYLNENEEMVVLNNIAILYSKENDFEKAEEYFFKAYKLALKQQNNIRIGRYAVNLGIVANQQDKLDKASEYLEKANEMLKDDPQIAILGKLAKVENLYKRGELKKAKLLANKTLPVLKTTSLSEEFVSLLILMSKIVYENGEMSSSIEFANKAILSTENPENKHTAYQQLAKIYEKLELFSDALSAKDSVIVLTEKINDLKNGKLFETNRVKFEIANYQRELKNNSDSRIRERRTLYSLLGVSFLVIILVTWALHNSFIKISQRKTLYERSKKIIALELQKKESDNLALEKQLHAKETMALLEQERLKNEIENRNQKLAAKALLISSRNELLKDIIDSLSGQLEVSRNVLLFKKINELKSLLKGKGEWDLFLTHFEEINHGFLNTIKRMHPELTSNDIRYICYLYMDLSNKEIAALFNITIEASRKRKERISNKLNLGEGADLYSYISGI